MWACQNQSCSEYPETYFGFGIFEIRWNLEILVELFTSKNAYSCFTEKTSGFALETVRSYFLLLCKSWKIFSPAQAKKLSWLDEVRHDTILVDILVCHFKYFSLFSTCVDTCICFLYHSMIIYWTLKYCLKCSNVPDYSNAKDGKLLLWCLQCLKFTYHYNFLGVVFFKGAVPYPVREWGVWGRIIWEQISDGDLFIINRPW